LPDAKPSDYNKSYPIIMPTELTMSKKSSNKTNYLISFVFLILVSIGVFGIKYIHPNIDVTKVLVSPIDGMTKLAIAGNIWLPQTNVLGADSLSLTAKSAFVIDPDTGDVLYEKDSRERLPIASLTKVMTTIVALENNSLNDTFKVPENVTQIDPDKMFLKTNETLTLEELLDGIFLVSANDAAETIAQDTTGNRDEFIKLMNMKALQIGMKDTLFINPTGLEEDDPSGNGLSKTQYSTAFDVALMSRYAIKHYPHLVDISSQPEIIIPQTSTHQDYTLENGINLITTYPGVLGFKIGYTPDAGLTIVTLAKRNGKTVLGVLFDCTNRRDDTKLVLDYAFKKLGV
jgi:serine-type D-Ala-D-Ala carboxypeptidase (penicillin-binding protein 5/6)